MSQINRWIEDERKGLEENRNKAPIIVTGLLRKTDQFYRDDRDSLLVVVGAGWNGIVRAAIKDPNQPAGADQLLFWPTAQRQYVEAVQRASVFVPSRGGFVPLMPGIISPNEMREAAEYLQNKAREITRVREALLTLADMVAGHGSDD